MFERRVHDGETAAVYSGVQGPGRAGGIKRPGDASRGVTAAPGEASDWRRHFLENAAIVFDRSPVANGGTEAWIVEPEQALSKKTLELKMAKKPRTSSGN